MLDCRISITFRDSNDEFKEFEIVDNFSTFEDAKHLGDAVVKGMLIAGAKSAHLRNIDVAFHL